MIRFITLFVLLAAGALLLAGCAGSQEVVADAALPPAPTLAQAQAQEPAEPVPDTQGDGPAAPVFENEAQVSDAGRVVIEVTPLKLDGTDGETLQFQVAMNTHSVDLSFDLAQLALLRTDQGDEVAGLAWDAPRGGHHVSGILSFPAVDLAEVQWFEIVLRDVAGVPERVLRWD